jgi:AAA15 family ATPase/GTPase
MNKAFFTDIKIENFKSLQSVELKGCNRINVLIGKPNVGKSNILEALSLFSLPHSLSLMPTRFNNSLKSYIRYENEGELFFNGNTKNSEPIKIQTNLIDCTVSFEDLEGLNIDFKGVDYEASIKLQLDERIGVPTMKYSLPYAQLFKTVKRYTFKSERQGLTRRNRHSSFLSPPFGTNLMQIIDNSPELTEYYASFFKEYGLDLVFDKTSSTVKIMKQIKDDYGDILKTIILPYSSMADTLQRVIFYKTAIVSNSDSILLFEEPEAHSFPPYIVHITQEIINSTSNQFFITTHSPFVLDDLMQNARNELAVFVVHWQNGETVAKKLTDAQLEDVYQYGVDLFTNIENYF